MSEPSHPESSDIETEFIDMNKISEDGEETDPRGTAFRIAEWVMEEFQPGFVIIGSPNLAETPAGYSYPDSVGIVLNREIELTPFELAAILEELARQLYSNVNQVEDFLKENPDGE